MLLRLLFPSWAFFDAVHEVPELEIRRCGGHAAADWEPALTAPRRPWYAIVFNARGNAHLAMQSVVDRFAVELELGLQDDVTCSLVEALVRRTIGQHAGDADALAWEWRVVAVQRPAAGPRLVMRTLYQADLIPRS